MSTVPEIGTARPNAPPASTATASTSSRLIAVTATPLNDVVVGVATRCPLSPEVGNAPETGSSPPVTGDVGISGTALGGVAGSGATASSVVEYEIPKVPVFASIPGTSPFASTRAAPSMYACVVFSRSAPATDRPTLIP